MLSGLDEHYERAGGGGKGKESVATIHSLIRAASHNNHPDLPTEYAKAAIILSGWLSKVT